MELMMSQFVVRLGFFALFCLSQSARAADYSPIHDDALLKKYNEDCENERLPIKQATEACELATEIEKGRLAEINLEKEKLLLKAKKRVLRDMGIDVPE